MTPWFFHYMFLIVAMKAIVNGHGVTDYSIGIAFLVVAAAIRHGVGAKIQEQEKANG